MDCLIIIKISKMKKLIYLFISILLFVGCSEKKIPKEEELKQYPWMEVFTPGRTDFIGIEHNLDLGTYSFSFKTRLSTIDIYFATTDSIALENKWEIIKTSSIKRKYRKVSSIYKASTGFDFITLEFNPENQRIILTSEINKTAN